MSATSARHRFETAAAERILVLDGAMGTMIQALGLDEAGYRGERFADHGKELSGDNDILCLSRPEAIAEIHRQFLDAGADILTSNSFNANRVSQADYAAEDLSHALNVAAARIAREAADAAEAEDGRPRFVAGALGPTNRTLSISPDVNDPGYRAITFDELADAYAEAAAGLIEGGADLLLIETVFDTLNAKAAIVACDRAQAAAGTDLPLMISGTITDRSGRTLTGQTPEAFWQSVRHADPVTVGLNCALGAAELRQHVKALSAVADTLICAYPNAGLPNELGGYDERPHETAEQIEGWARDGLVNVVGGCCGTTPEHIRAIAEAVAPHAPRAIPDIRPALRLSGLEVFEAGAGAEAEAAA